MKATEVDALLERTRSENPRERSRALRDLCPCKIRVNVEAVWRRVLEMASDPEPRVRSMVLHTLCDGSPSDRAADVVRVLEVMQQDADVRLRRRARGVMAVYRRTGRVNVL